MPVSNPNVGSSPKSATVDTDKLLPDFPASGSRDGKVPKFSGNDLGWEEDSDTTVSTQLTAHESDPNAHSEIPRPATVFEKGNTDKIPASKLPDGSGAGSGGTDQTARDGVEENKERLDKVEPLTRDIDRIVDGTSWANAPAAEAQFAVFGERTTIGQKLLRINRDPIDPAADIPSDTVWRTTLNPVPNDQQILVRIQRGLEPIQYRLNNSGAITDLYAYDLLVNDTNWDYYQAGGAGGGSMALERRNETFHTAYHGDLAGNALKSVNDLVTPVSTKVDTVETTANNAITRTAIFRPLSIWKLTNDARTLQFVYRPLEAVHTTVNATVVIGGITINNVNPTEGIAALDDVGYIFDIPITGVQAANITNSSDAIAGRVRCSISAGSADRITGWMLTESAPATSTAAAPKWRLLTGSSPYTVLATDDEFIIEMNYTVNTLASDFVTNVPKAALSTTAVNFAVNSDSRTVGFTISINSAGTELTVTKWRDSSQDVNDNRFSRWSIVNVFAR